MSKLPTNDYEPYNPPSAEKLRLENIALRKRMATALKAIEELLNIGQLDHSVPETPLSERDEARRLLEASSHSLRSYQYGNAATEPAKDMADAIDRFLTTGAPETLVGKGKR
jgi:hypothetical protein